MKNKVLKIFLSVFLKTGATLIAMILVAVGTYYGTIKIHGVITGDKETVTDVDDIIAEAQIDDVSKNLMYVTKDGNKDELAYVVLEVFNTNAEKMTYITVPVTTQITVSSELYPKLTQVEKEVPQIFELVNLPQFFEDDKAYGYGVVLFEDYFGIDISYYTVVTEEEFKKAFTTATKTVEYEETASSDDATTEETAEETSELENQVIRTDVEEVQLTTDFLSEMSSYKTEDDLSEYIENEYKNISSNLSVTEKIGYVEKYLNLSQENITYECIPGREDTNKIYLADLDACAEMFEKTNADAAVTTEKTTQEEGDDSKEEDTTEAEASNTSSKIMILNGASVNGLAAFFKERLENAGYTNVETGNYTSGTITTTQIYVKTESQGKDLLNYFPGANIVVQQISEDVDIEIVLGRESASEYSTEAAN